MDARRGISEYYLYGVAVLVLLLFIPGLRGSGIVDVLIVAILLIIIGEGWWVSRRVIALAQERFPGESVRGVRMYTALRGTQLRRMRDAVTAGQDRRQGLTSQASGRAISTGPLS